MKAMFVQRILVLQLFSILILNFTRSILLLIRFAAVVTITRAYSFGVLLCLSEVDHFCVQVSSLKDTISRKDMEIDQLLKNKAKSPGSSIDRNDSRQQIRRLSGKGFMF
jgi:hypothetical protein